MKNLKNKNKNKIQMCTYRIIFLVSFILSVFDIWDEAVAILLVAFILCSFLFFISYLFLLPIYNHIFDLIVYTIEKDSDVLKAYKFYIYGSSKHYNEEIEYLKQKYKIFLSLRKLL